MTQRRGGRPKGPERVPFTTTLRPEALEALRQRSQDTYRTARAVNRVIEEGIMGLAAVKETARVPTTIYVDRDEETDVETSVIVVFELDGDGSAVDWHIASALAGGDASSPVRLTSEEADRACEQAHAKYCANKSDYR